MGIDVVELLMEVEDVFDLQIEDDDYAELRTVGELYEYIVARKGEAYIAEKKREAVEQPARPPVCLTLATFALLRPALVSMTGVERRSIRPATSVDELSPSWRRRDDWEALRNIAHLDLPELRRPTWLVAGLSVMSVGVVLSAIHGLTFLLPTVAAWMFGAAVVGPLFVTALTDATRPYATLLPVNCGTVGGLSRVVLARNFHALQQRYRGWGGADVWGTLCAIVSDELNVPPEEIHYESRFVEDLKAD